MHIHKLILVKEEERLHTGTEPGWVPGGPGTTMDFCDVVLIFEKKH